MGCIVHPLGQVPCTPGLNPCSPDGHAPSGDITSTIACSALPPIGAECADAGLRTWRGTDPRRTCGTRSRASSAITRTWALRPQGRSSDRAGRVRRVACFCGHSFLRSETSLSIVRHPPICVVAGHRITYVGERAGFSEYVCRDCGHPFCFAGPQRSLEGRHT
jgi:hypothetical protein